ncbi:hypothetical protein UlMin_025404 [Ulmus minor]
MQTMRIPAFICSKLDARIRSFWWGSSSESRKPLCLKAWDSLYKPKSYGGLGFRKIDEFNRALLVKWGWSILTNVNSLCLSVLRSRYIQYDRFFDIPKKIGDSPFWKAILDIRNLLANRACYFKPTPIVEPNRGCNRVKDFISHLGSWDVQKLFAYFTPTDVTSILKITIPLNPKLDYWV